MSQNSSQQALADLQQVASDIQNGVSGLQAADAAILAFIQQLEANNGVQPGDVEAVVATLKGASAGIQAVTSQLTSGSQPPAPAPTPTPAP